MYEYSMRVGYSQTDENRKMNIAAIIDAFQDCSCFHSDSLDVGFDYLIPMDLVWILNYWEIELDTVPAYGEEITVGTFPYLFRSFLGHRNFYIKNKNNELIVKANSLWTLMDWKKMKPSKPTEKILNAYILEEKLDMEYNSRKIALPESCEIKEEEKIVIHKNHLDSNGHVNNGQYVKIALAYAPSDRAFRRLRAEYRNQAHLGDTIVPVLYSNDDVCTISLNDEDGKAYCVIELQY